MFLTFATTFQGIYFIALTAALLISIIQRLFATTSLRCVCQAELLVSFTCDVLDNRLQCNCLSGASYLH